MRDEGEQSNTTVCEACGTAVPSYDAGATARSTAVIASCAPAASMPRWPVFWGWSDFEHVRLQPIVMTDCAGEQHEFHFQIRLLGDVMTLEAFELKAGVPGGYQFEMLGNQTANHCRCSAA